MAVVAAWLGGRVRLSAAVDAAGRRGRRRWPRRWTGLGLARRCEHREFWKISGDVLAVEILAEIFDRALLRFSVVGVPGPVGVLAEAP